MLPLIKYSGGKSRELDNYLSYIPDYDIYYEPFFGGGATYFAIQPSKAYVADINEPLIKFYKSYVEDYARVKKELSSLGEIYKNNHILFNKCREDNPGKRIKDLNENLYYQIRSMFNSEAPSKYAYGTLYYFINKLAYSGMIRYNKQGKFNVPFGRYANFNTELATLGHKQLLETATIANESYQASFEKATENDFIFLDPPYDTTFSDYGNETLTGDFDERSHKQLAEDFKNISAKALMIIGETPLISELYSGYIQGAYEKKYAVNIRNRVNSSAKHLIIANYNIKGK